MKVHIAWPWKKAPHYGRKPAFGYEREYIGNSLIYVGQPHVYQYGNSTCWAWWHCEERKYKGAESKKEAIDAADEVLRKMGFYLL